MVASTKPKCNLVEKKTFQSHCVKFRPKNCQKVFKLSFKISVKKCVQTSILKRKSQPRIAVNRQPKFRNYETLMLPRYRKKVGLIKIFNYYFNNGSKLKTKKQSSWKKVKWPNHIMSNFAHKNSKKHSISLLKVLLKTLCKQVSLNENINRG